MRTSPRDRCPAGIAIGGGTVLVIGATLLAAAVLPTVPGLSMVAVSWRDCSSPAAIGLVLAPALRPDRIAPFEHLLRAAAAEPAAAPIAAPEPVTEAGPHAGAGPAQKELEEVKES